MLSMYFCRKQFVRSLRSQRLDDLNSSLWYGRTFHACDAIFCSWMPLKSICFLYWVHWFTWCCIWQLAKFVQDSLSCVVNLMCCGLGDMYESHLFNCGGFMLLEPLMLSHSVEYFLFRNSISRLKMQNICHLTTGHIDLYWSYWPVQPFTCGLNW